jgi:hypothetical protein
MLNNVFWLGVDAALSFAIALVFWLSRKSKYLSFGDWWNAEGIAIWMIAGVILFIILDGAGKFREA